MSVLRKFVKSSFELGIVNLDLNLILPTRKVADSVLGGKKFLQIVSSIAEVGMVEPLVVARPNKATGCHLLLDGHLRLAVLRQRGERQARCLIAADDEAFTYNKRVSRLSTVQEHRMIVQAIERGVPEEKLARALNIKPEELKQKRDLLVGICQEAADLIKNKLVPIGVFTYLRKMKPCRQVEVVELMLGVGNLSHCYAKGLLLASKPGDLVKPPAKPDRNQGTSERIDRLVNEISSLRDSIGNVEANYGREILNLVTVRGFLSKLLTNIEILSYVKCRHPEIEREFRAIVDSRSLDMSGGDAG